jgi:hypothetical protein
MRMLGGSLRLRKRGMRFRADRACSTGDAGAAVHILVQADRNTISTLGLHNRLPGWGMGHMDKNIADLIANAKAVSVGMIRIAAAKPNDYPLQSNAQTFRGAATMLHALSEEVARHEARAADMSAKLQRIADLKVRGAAEAIQSGDWKAVVDELQTLAQEALAPGSGSPRLRGAGPDRDIPRR